MLSQIDIQNIVTIAKEAGDAIMQVSKQDFEVECKQDNSPITLADKKANNIKEKHIYNKNNLLNEWFLAESFGSIKKLTSVHI